MITQPKVNNLPELIEFISRRNSGNIKYDLDRINTILARMGHPEKQLRGIHVAGTNGKGSTSAITEAICSNHNWTTGMNTSPHLVDYRERFRINGQDISAWELIDLYNKWSSLFEETEASFFEITTALAFYHFFSLQLHTCIFEVGLGGRLDATNPFNSSVSIITSIAIDHPKTLGNTIEKIAYEKAGIIKESVPLIIGNLSRSAYNVISNVAKERSSLIYAYGEDFHVENILINNLGTTFDFVNTKGKLNLPERINNLQTNLIGAHQAHNASLAIAGFSVYYEKITGNCPDLSLISEGIKKINWLGRMQIIGQQPLTLLDCAHNEEGIENLVKNLKTLFPHKRFRIIIAILRDKNIEYMLSLLCLIATKLYITKNNSERAADIQEQVKIAEKCGVDFIAEDNIVSALETATREASEEEIIIVTGSIYTVSEIIAHRGKKITTP